MDAFDSRVAEIAAVLSDYRWTPLARCLPMREVYTRPAELGDYQAIEWRARWAGAEGGPILVEVAGYVSPAHDRPVTLRLVEIHRRDWRARIMAWLGLGQPTQPPRCVSNPHSPWR